MSRSRTTITIAHRLSTIRKADKIVVIRAGKAIEEGTHEQLLWNDDGVYSAFVRAQAVEMGDEERDSSMDIEEEPIYVGGSAEAGAQFAKDGSIKSEEEAKPKYKTVGFMGSFGLPPV